MAEILCDQVGQGLRESERTVSVKDVHGRRQYITVEHDFLTVTPEKKYYLPVGVVHVDRKTGALLVELPHEAYSGANRLWVSSQDLLEPTETTAWAAGWCPGGNQANLTVPLPKRKSRPRPYPLHDRKDDGRAIKRPVDAFGAHLTSHVQCLTAKPNPPADGIDSYCLSHSVRGIVLALVFGPYFAGLDGVNPKRNSEHSCFASKAGKTCCREPQGDVREICWTARGKGIGGGLKQRNAVRGTGRNLQNSTTLKLSLLL